jgi:uncharacterized protein
MMMTDFYALWDCVIAGSLLPHWSLHGPRHWRRVEKNGLLLATRTGANTDVVRLFALFHDSRRVNESRDDGHGARGAAYAASLRGNAFDLPDDLFELLSYACTWHTDGGLHDDPTIGSCWDADRLDLGRVFKKPKPEFMCTGYGRELARRGGV